MKVAPSDVCFPAQAGRSGVGSASARRRAVPGPAEGPLRGGGMGFPLVAGPGALVGECPVAAPDGLGEMLANGTVS